MLRNKKYPYPASLACQVRSAIRCADELPFETMAKIFRGELPFEKSHKRYFLGFFEECYPSLIHKFMKEQNISRDNILYIFQQLPRQGETIKFERILLNGQF